MDNPTTIISQNVINVDIDSIAVTLPVNFNLGVMYDNSCKIITFMVQKKSDITDLTDLTFSINTVSVKGTPDKLECDTREEGGFYIITAVLKGTIFEASGKATFNLCGQKFDSSHVAVKAWGSEDITALVGEHSHADKAIEELYPSVLEELRQKVNNPNLTDEQLNDIAQKIAEKGFYTKSEIDSIIAGIVIPTRLSQLADDTEHRTVTDAEKEKWNKPSIAVDTELSDTSENPVQNKAVSKGMDSLSSILISHFNSQLDYFEEAVDEQLNTKADKTALDLKVDKSSVDTVLDANSNNPIANKVITTRLNGMYEGLADKADRTELENYATKAELDTKADKTALDAKADKFTIDNEVKSDSNNPVSSKAVSVALRDYATKTELGEKADKTELDKKLNKSDVATAFTNDTVVSDKPISTKAVYELVGNAIPNMEFSIVGKIEDVTKTPSVLLSMSCMEVIIIGANLEATGNGKVEIVIDGSEDNYGTIIHGINNGVTNTVQSTYIAELKNCRFWSACND